MSPGAAGREEHTQQWLQQQPAHPACTHRSPVADRQRCWAQQLPVPAPHLQLGCVMQEGEGAQVGGPEPLLLHTQQRQVAGLAHAAHHGAPLLGVAGAAHIHRGGVGHLGEGGGVQG
jgi:hypothetical protein